MSRHINIPDNVHIELVSDGLRIDIPRVAQCNDGELPQVVSLLLPKASKDDLQSQKLLRDLRCHPFDLAALIEKGPEALAPVSKRLELVPPWRYEGDSDGMASDVHTGAIGQRLSPDEILAMDYGDVLWKKDMSLQLALLGWTKESLIAAVWEAWAQAAPLPDAELALREAAGQPEEPPRGAANEGPSIAEWLAEMAEQGRLHLPGPQFHDVEIGLHIVEQGSEPAADASQSDGLAALLPGVPGAAKGFSQVAAQVMQRAEQLAAPLRGTKM
ncbi:hypothetical protein FHR92_004856 [Fontibacillus solani]|uniref:Uncharacterized protein n=1 Tax=Fontibacillus solani TaxID=1572857 RepID=A0A7W3SYN5_9BACL|nr:hypothetical protein [Fontibacillus solani]MBA9088358.1 hypothetical protein [Fontibacillus solani]